MLVNLLNFYSIFCLLDYDKNPNVLELFFNVDILLLLLFNMIGVYLYVKASLVLNILSVCYYLDKSPAF